MSKDPKSAVSRESDKFMLRFPDGMRAQVAESAKRNGRSMNAEIVHILQSFFDLCVPDDYRYDELEEGHIGTVEHFAPKAALPHADRPRNLFISYSEDNKLLASLLRQQLELMNKIVGSQPDEPFLNEGSQSIKKAAATQRKSRAKRPLTNPPTINDVPTLANAPTLADVPTLNDLPSLSDDTKPRRIKRTPPKAPK